ncbi:hypothetical protein [Neisseria sp.]|uniref:hypothetical protein n=1 Tax=Neisseria sp. TaxID=192066 RepID=UPI0026DAAD65|nr:hypothetical protein [Neisseria sp.]MDO4906698.1 hypothetical protein [Neisseria sp.]
MFELEIRDLEVVSGGGWPILGAIAAGAARVASTSAARNAAIGAGTYTGYSYLSGNEITAAGVAGAMVGGSVGGAIKNTTGAAIAGSATAGATEGLVNGNSPLLNRDKNDYDAGGGEY